MKRFGRITVWAQLTVLLLLVGGLPGFSRPGLTDAITIHENSASQVSPAPPILVSQIGGATKTLVAENTTVVLNVGPRLVVADASNPRAPRIAGRTDPLPGVPSSIALASPYAYVATADELRVFDLSRRESPREVAALTSRPLDSLLLDGSTLYAFGFGTGLVVFDLTRPEMPLEIAQVDLGRGFGARTGHRLALEGQTLYVAAGNRGLLTVDVSAKTEPVVIASELTRRRDPVGRDARASHSVAVAGGYAYVVYGNPAASPMYYSQGVAVLDVRGPSQPVEVYFDTRNGERFNAGTTLVHQDHLYFARSSANFGYSALAVYQTVEPDQPEDSEAWIAVHEEPDVSAFAFAGTRAYTLRDGMLQVLDLESPWTPSVLGEVSVTGQILLLTVNGNLAHLRGASNYRVLDVSNPSLPQEVGRISIPRQMGLRVDRGRTYIGNDSGMNREHGVVDTSDPRQLRYIGTLEWPNWDIGFGTLVARGKAFTWTGRQEGGRLSIHSLDATELRLLGELEDPRLRGIGADRVAIAGQTLVIAAGNDLILVDLTDVQQPTIASVVPLEDRIYGVAGTETHFYLALRPASGQNQRRGLSVWDAKDPTNPREIGFHASDFDPHIPMVYGNRLLLPTLHLEADHYLRFDISDPLNLRAERVAKPPQRSWQIGFNGSHFFVAEKDAGLFVYRLPS